MTSEKPAFDADSRPSWDVERETAPPRPEFVSSLPEEMFVPRPKRVIVAWVLVLIGVLGALTVLALAALQIEQLRETMLAAVPEDLTEDYDESDIERAVDVMLAAVGGLAALIAIGQLLSMTSLVFRRSTAARVVFMVFLLLSVPVTLLVLIVREAGEVDIMISALLILIMFTAAIIVSTKHVSIWLRQSDPPRSLPLLPRETATDTSGTVS